MAHRSVSEKLGRRSRQQLRDHAIEWLQGQHRRPTRREGQARLRPSGVSADAIQRRFMPAMRTSAYDNS